MRDIKFRAWLEGTHGSTTWTKPYMEYGVSVGPEGGYLDIESGWDIHGEFKTVPVMQYTGLKDKNGKEIYEGDIVHRIDIHEREGNFKIEYKGSGFWLKGHSMIGANPEALEVIGNIYENPDLLKK